MLNVLPYVIRFAAKIRRNSARLLIPLQLYCEERESATRQSLQNTKRGFI
ncbi:MAG: hypothetical protein LBL66_07460 [Clostridiales bacterium]|nr:hypothetical protein [Clostridiales bacterium]